MKIMHLTFNSITPTSLARDPQDIRQVYSPLYPSEYPALEPHVLYRVKTTSGQLLIRQQKDKPVLYADNQYLNPPTDGIILDTVTTLLYFEDDWPIWGWQHYDSILPTTKLPGMTIEIERLSPLLSVPLSTIQPNATVK